MHLVTSVRLCVCQRSPVNVKGHGQMFWRVAVDIRGSALPSAAKANNYRQVSSKKDYYQSKMFVCVCNLGASDNRADAADWLLIFMIINFGHEPIQH